MAYKARTQPRARRRGIGLLVLGCGLTLGVLWGLAFPAQTRSIVVVKSHDVEPFNQALAGFVAACNNRIVEYDLRGSARRGQRLVKRIRATKPNFILAIGSLAAQVLKQRVRDIPVVFFMVPNPHKFGLEGDNLAGISLDIPVETQFRTYRLLLPTLRTIGVIYDPDKTGAMIHEAQDVSRRFDLRLHAVPVSSPKAVPPALRRLLGDIEALWMVPDDTVITPDSFKFLLVQAFEHNLPFLAVSDIFVEVGALAALSPDYTALGRQGCELVNEIDSGRLSPADVDVLPPAKVNLAINLKTANKIGLTLPSEMIQSASKVYR